MTREEIEKAANIAFTRLGDSLGLVSRAYVVEFATQQVNRALEEAAMELCKMDWENDDDGWDLTRPVERIRALKIP